MKKISLLLFLFILLHFSLFAQKRQWYQQEEHLYFKGYYNLSFLWVAAGEVHLTTSRARYNNSDALKIYAVGRNFNAFNYIYKLRDTMICYADVNTLRPYFFDRRTHEAKEHRMNRYWFKENIIRSQMQKRGGKLLTDTILYTPNTHDLLTVAYYARTINYDSCKINQKIPLNILINNKIHNLYIRYKGIDTIKSDWGEKISCYKLSPLLVAGTMFKSGEGMTVWLSRDKQRLPVMVEAKVLVGSVKGMLQKQGE